MTEYQHDVDAPPLCLDASPANSCSGDVEYHSIDGLRAWPRCEKHFDLRLDRYEDIMEKYAQSDVAPSWFDPADAGERWDYDY